VIAKIELIRRIFCIMELPIDIWNNILHSDISKYIIVQIRALSYAHNQLIEENARLSGFNYVKYVLQKCNNISDQDTIWYVRAFYAGYFPLLRDFHLNFGSLENIFIKYGFMQIILHKYPKLINLYYENNIFIPVKFLELYNMYQIYNNKPHKIRKNTLMNDISIMEIQVGLNKVQKHDDETEYWAYMYGIPELFNKKNMNKYSYPLIPNITISNSVINHTDVINNTISCESILKYYVIEGISESVIIARISGEFVLNKNILVLIVIREYYKLARLFINNNNCNYIVSWIKNSDLLEFMVHNFEYHLSRDIGNLIDCSRYLDSIGL
jgi:hypothetical protein